MMNKEELKFELTKSAFLMVENAAEYTNFIMKTVKEGVSDKEFNVLVAHFMRKLDLIGIEIKCYNDFSDGIQS